MPRTRTASKKKAPTRKSAARKKPVSAWRKGFHQDEVVQRVRPIESGDWLPNPHRGTTTFQRFNGDELYPDMWWNDREGPLTFPRKPSTFSNPHYPNTTVSYCRWLWSVIEPKKGKYRWDIIDGALKCAASRGQTLQTRVQPFIGADSPAWYWETGAKGLKQTSKNGEYLVFDHNDPKYLKHWGDFVKAFARRYDGHPALESFDVAYGGPCGETGGNATKATSIKLVEVYRKAFKHTTLVSLLGTHGCAYHARFDHIGWRADCLGDMRVEGGIWVPENKNWNHMYDAYPKEVFENGVTDTWKTAPVTLETCWTVPYWKKHGWDLDFILRQALKYHTSVFMPKSCFIPDEWREKIADFDRRLGYRFVLRQATLPLEAKPGAKMDWRLWIENIGVAPIYRPYRLALRFRQGKVKKVAVVKADPRTWLPGDVYLHRAVTLPKGLKPGVADVDIGIVDVKDDTPKVWFAIKELHDDGWHPLTKMDIL